MKINQYCSVCKKHLDMDVIPTDDGGDDGVIWLRCPECQGFLPKFTGEGYKPPAPAADETPTADAEAPPAGTEAEPPVPEAVPADVDLPAPDVGPEPIPVDDEEADGAESADEVEPLAEYAAALAGADPAAARPYRPGDHYAIGDVVHHLAYDDIGVVVAKETLPGGRKVAKVYFEQAGVVRLIEQAADSRR